MPLFIWCISFIFFPNEFAQIYFPTNNHILIFFLFVSWLVLSFSNFSSFNCYFKGLPGGARGKDPLVNAGDARDMGSNPWVRDICLISKSGKP